MEKVAVIDVPEGRDDVASIAAGLMNGPVKFFGSYDRMQHLDPQKREAAQLKALRERFSDLRDRLPMLKKLADEQRVEEISALDDVVPLLFPHTVYKSYPTSLLMKNHFPELTRWVAKLTIIDLGGADERSAPVEAMAIAVSRPRPAEGR